TPPGSRARCRRPRGSSRGGPRAGPAAGPRPGSTAPPSSSSLHALFDQHVALLVLLAAPARAGVVAPDAGAAAHRLGVRGGGLGTVAAATGARGARGNGAPERLGLGVLRHHAPRSRALLDRRRAALELDPEQPLHEVLAH